MACAVSSNRATSIPAAAAGTNFENTQQTTQAEAQDQQQQQQNQQQQQQQQAQEMAEAMYGPDTVESQAAQNRAAEAARAEALAKGLAPEEARKAAEKAREAIREEAKKAVEEAVKAATEPSLAVNVTADVSELVPGASIELTADVENVVVTDDLPDGLRVREGEQEAVRREIGNLPAGESREFTVDLCAMQTGQFASRAVAQSGELRAQSNNPTTRVVAARLAATMEGPEAQYLNQPATYRVTVRNEGDLTVERSL